MGGREPTLEELVTAIAAPDPEFWRDRRVLLTGHTGFKGAWLALWLARMGAEVHGFALPPETDPSLWHALGDGLLADQTLADLADAGALRDTVRRARPQVVVHLAAQALVRRGIADPVGTVATNVLGTARLLDALRGLDGLEALLVVTTDKVYAPGARRAFGEDDALGGRDPYSASKAAAELIVRSFAATWFEPAGVKLATARAGNAIGGGDWAEGRLVPDVWRAVRTGRPLLLRAPDSVRPWQHVLEPLAGYLLLVEALVRGDEVPPALNFGPAPGTPLTVAELATLVGNALGLAEPWRADDRGHPPETEYLALDADLARATIGWAPRLDARQAAEWTSAWYAGFAGGASARALCLDQLSRYEALA